VAGRRNNSKEGRVTPSLNSLFWWVFYELCNAIAQGEIVVKEKASYIRGQGGKVMVETIVQLARCKPESMTSGIDHSVLGRRKKRFMATQSFVEEPNTHGSVTHSTEGRDATGSAEAGGISPIITDPWIYADKEPGDSALELRGSEGGGGNRRVLNVDLLSQ